MAMYAIGILPLIHHLNRTSVHQVWYADDAAALGKLFTIRSWWEELQCHGPLFGYYLKSTKSWLIVKREIEETACSVFADIDINITSEGHQYLWSPIGSEHYISNFIKDKISEWVSQLEKFTTVAQTQPHASLSGLIHGFFNKLVYLCRTTLGVCQHIHPLEDCLRRRLIPF